MLIEPSRLWPFSILLWFTCLDKKKKTLTVCNGVWPFFQVSFKTSCQKEASDHSQLRCLCHGMIYPMCHWAYQSPTSASIILVLATSSGVVIPAAMQPEDIGIVYQ